MSRDVIQISFHVLILSLVSSFALARMHERKINDRRGKAVTIVSVDHNGDGLNDAISFSYGALVETHQDYNGDGIADLKTIRGPGYVIVWSIPIRNDFFKMTVRLRRKEAWYRLRFYKSPASKEYRLWHVTQIPHTRQFETEDPFEELVVKNSAKTASVVTGKSSTKWEEGLCSLKAQSGDLSPDWLKTFVGTVETEAFTSDSSVRRLIDKSCEPYAQNIRCAFSARLRAAPRLAVQLAAITVEQATVERLPAAISELSPHLAAVDGLLGMDFLGQFIVTLDRAAQQMWLASRQPVKQ